MSKTAFYSLVSARNILTKAHCTIKVINKGKLRNQEKQLLLVKSELKVLENVVHPNILQVFELLENDRFYYIVTENLNPKSNNLFKMISKMPELTEADVATIVQQLVSTLNYLHNQRIMVRDLKPETIMCE